MQKAWGPTSWLIKHCRFGGPGHTCLLPPNGDFNADYQSYTSELMHEILKHYSSVTNKSLVVSFLCCEMILRQ